MKKEMTVKQVGKKMQKERLKRIYYSKMPGGKELLNDINEIKRSVQQDPKEKTI